MLQYNPRYGGSNYNALQMQYNLHMAHSDILQVAYTFSKLLSDTDNTSSFLDGQGAQGLPQDNYNLKAEKSLSMQDITNNLVIDYGFDLPFGHGQPYLNNKSGAVNAVLGGWRLNGITIFRSGVPIALTAPANVLSQFGAVSRGSFGPSTPSAATKAVLVRCTALSVRRNGSIPRASSSQANSVSATNHASIQRSVPMVKPTSIRYSARVLLCRAKQLSSFRARSSTYSTTRNSACLIAW